ncbi:FadR/GntR family transcriptional regulator [Pararhodobacter zhoushanensis]|uniref:GntR family transcriptional regulator n=1 Tax=Pararhodobacter zhoushanensis TaxID=2479545 RepID=A0ABT3H5C0_9RHOB|nr:GntR family transcriptional regulator [Pararhodobacter zhoushanensis]MCW1934989.1 GntR family transcriptional regulator [Pararhodobacter zhoushanensis]
MAFKPISGTRAFEVISEQVRAQIEARQLRPGDKLPPERELAVQFGVSRNAVREALRGLESSGLIGLHKGVHGGAFVLEPSNTPVLRSFRDMMSLGQISLDNLTAARIGIMKVILESAAQAATPDDLRRLERNIDATEAALKARRDDELLELTADFYNLLAEATQNPVLVLVITPIYEIVRRFVVAAGIRATEPVIDSRRALLVKLRARDAKGAIALMVEHLETVHAAILRRFPEGVMPAVETPT